MVEHILFVEGDQDDEELLREHMENVGFPHFHFCSTAEAAQTYLQSLALEELPGVIVCDLFLPTLSGEAFVRQILKDTRLAGIYLVVYSATLIPDLELQLKFAGVKECFIKPRNVGELSGMIQRLIALANEHSQLKTKLLY
jgi:CheY-like chemotaxis protein